MKLINMNYFGYEKSENTVLATYLLVQNHEHYKSVQTA